MLRTHVLVLMSLFHVDVALLDLHNVDEDESEGVALCLIERVFAETNALYRQHCLAKQAVASTAALLTSSVLDAVFCSQLAHETSLDRHRFNAEPSPTPETNDRHAARCLPHRNPDKPAAAGCAALPTQRTRLESRAVDRSSMSLARKRLSPDKIDSLPPKSATVKIPQAIAIAELVEEETPEQKAWRIKCLKELNGEARGPTRLGGAARWTTFTRQIPLAEPRVAVEVEIVENSTPQLRQEVSGAASANAVKMKSSLNTFSSISTSPMRTGSAASSVASRTPTLTETSASKRPSLSGAQSVPSFGSAPRKASALQLHDSLSRNRSSARASHDHQQNGASSSMYAESDPWQFELQKWTPRTTMRNKFVPDMMVASASTIPTTISLAAGVEFAHGEAVVKGPERRENDQTMSRKRFELHQRLATDQLLQESMLQSPGSPSSYSLAGSKSPLSPHHRQASPRPYETVPPDPVPVMSLSPIAKTALVIPRNHLAQSASTPSLRVRNPSVRKRGEGSLSSSSSSHRLVTAEELEAIRKARPNSALGEVVVSTPRQKGAPRGFEGTRRPKTSTTNRSAASAYLREFPKPHAGTIQLNARKASVLDPTEADSARQRLAWIS